MNRVGLLVGAAVLALYLFAMRGDGFPWILLSSPHHPFLTVDVQQRREGVYFELFYGQETPLGLAKRTYPCHYLTVEKYDRTVWEIRAKDFGAEETRIQYGTLPKGFEEVVPRRGAPPPLEFGNKYRVWSCGDSTTFIYEGAARKTK